MNSKPFDRNLVYICILYIIRQNNINFAENFYKLFTIINNFVTSLC